MAEGGTGPWGRWKGRGMRYRVRIVENNIVNRDVYVEANAVLPEEWGVLVFRGGVHNHIVAAFNSWEYAVVDECCEEGCECRNELGKTSAGVCLDWKELQLYLPEDLMPSPEMLGRHPTFKGCPNDPGKVWVLSAGGYILKDKLSPDPGCMCMGADVP